MEQREQTQTHSWNLKNVGLGLGCALVCTIILAIITLVGFRVCCVTFVENYELGYSYDRLNGGKIERLSRTGYIFHKPIVFNVHTIDLRPIQVCLNANKRVLNCKLVEFNPAGLEVFLSLHGRANYSGDESQEHKGTFKDILSSYAFDGKSYTFLTILRELKNEEVQPSSK